MKTILDLTLRYWFWNRVQIIVNKINGKLRVSLYFFEYNDNVEDWVISKIRYIGGDYH